MTPECVNEWLSDTCAFSRGSSLLGCFVRLRCDGFYFFLSYFFCYIHCHLSESYSFLTRDRKGVALDGRGGWEELGGVEGGGNVIRIYYMRKNPILMKGFFFSKLRCV